MANTLTNFVVGIGFDFDKKGAAQAENAIDGLRKNVLGVGAALAGAFGARQLTSGFAEFGNRVGNFSQTFGVLPDDVRAVGNAFQHVGGSVDGFISQLQTIQKLRSGVQIGETGFIGQAARAGVDVSELINAKDAVQAYLSLADQFQGLSTSQRINAASALGLDASSIRLLSMGSDKLDAMIESEREIRPLTRQMTEDSRAFNIQLQKLSNNIGSVADTISTKLLPPLTAAIASFNDFFSESRLSIISSINKGLDFIAENFATVASVGGLLATGGLLGGLSLMARLLPFIGTWLSRIAISGAKLSAIGAAIAGVGSAAYNFIFGDSEDDKPVNSGVNANSSQPQEAQSQSLAKRVISDGQTVADRFAFSDAPPALINSIVKETSTSDAPAAVTPVSQITPEARERLPDLKVVLQLDGKVIEEKMIDVMGRHNEIALDQLSN